jgi:hypothetical protein
VDGKGRVVQIEVRDNQLTSVPAALGNLAALTTWLDLGNNQLTSVPAEIGSLASLTSLSLDKNRLTSVPAELEGLTALQRLYLFDNQLTSVPAAIGNLTSLTTLSLDSNQLTSVPASLSNLTALTYLTLYSNQLTSVPAELGGLTALQHLSLFGNQLTSVPAMPAELGNLTSLTTLSLGSNQLTNVPAELGKLTALNFLELHYNQLTTVGREPQGSERFESRGYPGFVCLARGGTTTELDARRQLHHPHLRKYVGRTDGDPGTDVVAILSPDERMVAVARAAHPRYTRVLRHHGLPQLLSDASKKGARVEDPRASCSRLRHGLVPSTRRLRRLSRHHPSQVMGPRRRAQRPRGGVAADGGVHGGARGGQGVVANPAGGSGGGGGGGICRPRSLNRSGDGGGSLITSRQRYGERDNVRMAECITRD